MGSQYTELDIKQFEAIRDNDRHQELSDRLVTILQEVERQDVAKQSEIIAFEIPGRSYIDNSDFFPEVLKRYAEVSAPIAMNLEIRQDPSTNTYDYSLAAEITTGINEQRFNYQFQRNTTLDTFNALCDDKDASATITPREIEYLILRLATLNHPPDHALIHQLQHSTIHISDPAIVALIQNSITTNKLSLHTHYTSYLLEQTLPDTEVPVSVGTMTLVSEPYQQDISFSHYIDKVGDANVKRFTFQVTVSSNHYDNAVPPHIKYTIQTIDDPLDSQYELTESTLNDLPPYPEDAMTEYILAYLNSINFSDLKKPTPPSPDEFQR